jgi:hypothetical protein
MGRSLIPFEQFQSDLHRQWKKDRALRQRIPLRETWRGCLGLAALLQDMDDIEFHGEHALYRNEQVTWICLRDVPVGHFPGSPRMNRREVNYANTAKATLRHGMPTIDFAVPDRRAVDFRFFPHGEFIARRSEFRSELIRPWADVLDSDARSREFGVLNKLSAAMTNFAFFATDSLGKPCRRSWAAHRPRIGSEFLPIPPKRWMPRPYLGFTLAQAERLYHAATESSPDSTVFECPSCGSRCRIEHFREPGRRLTVFEDGDFVAVCPRCGGRRKWHLDDAITPRPQRRFPAAFPRGFCDALVKGLPLRSVGRTRYLGHAKFRRQGHHRHGTHCPARRLSLTPHAFAAEWEGGERIAFLPRDARVTVRVGEVLEPGEVFAYALPTAATGWWRGLDFRDRWATAEQVCGDKEMLEFLQMLWFHNQAVSLQRRPELLLYPADLVCLAVRDVPPQGLWWDFNAAGELNLVDMGLEAVVFPPIRLAEWDRFQLSVPGDVALDAGIADPRFASHGLPCSSKRGSRSARVDSRNVASSAHPSPNSRDTHLLVA